MKPELVGVAANELPQHRFGLGELVSGNRFLRFGQLAPLAVNRLVMPPPKSEARRDQEGYCPQQPGARVPCHDEPLLRPPINSCRVGGAGGSGRAAAPSVWFQVARRGRGIPLAARLKAPAGRV